MTFDELKFEPRYPKFGPDDIRARHTFNNGYGISVIRGRGTYGSEHGLYELAVLGPDGHLDYTTPITDNVEGYLTPDDVTRLMAEVAALPAKGK